MSDNEERRGPGHTWPQIAPFEVLMLFTAGWLGGQGALTMVARTATGAERVMGGAELISAVLWFVPRLRLAGFGATVAVLAIAIVYQLLARQLPGALIFYAAVTLYLAWEEGRRRPPATPPA